ncbi:Dyp-type peroxidase [Conexibacter woesei]|uniref:Dyp-type peroxidase n=1 Tax=Conexibacter woesei TaxID=191495 RepID=UPI0004221124|nr:Dyp-type peroxidase [Conexibacter woesei]
MSPIDRRTFVRRSLGLAGAAGAGALGAERLSGPATARADDDVAETAREQGIENGILDTVAFDGPHQGGILTPVQAHATVAALDAVAPDRTTLMYALQALSARARTLAVGGVTPRFEVDDPPVDSGVLGPDIAPGGLTVTIGFGVSLFDDRYGLKDKKPEKLERMPPFAGEDLDASQTHGDVLVQICANQRDTVVHTLREIMRATRGALELRWAVDGFAGARRGPTPRASPRNLFAFRDGTANPDVRDDAAMRRLVWDAQGGSYQVVRLIRMHVEFWDRVGLREQETMIGRTRDTGAPLGGDDEFQDPRYDIDPKGDRIPLDAHIRLANPRTRATEDQRFLRRPYNYHRGFDSAGSLDQGMVFMAYNQDPARQFATVQNRLAGEPMTDYFTHVGGGYFYAPRGTGGKAGWIGQDLFA